ncbi:Mitochondrial substrate/solute carrier [Parasponia andersonii]|uniref:Mitochondrial substrate/solute carrier n=1 Tax=Parasponia andersonii TaxID=3476 RepID=A0A2P5CTV4_PARAD|nr:Mitochondrial substrate/solute carrier [Parasponia andersonii]
MGGDGGSSDGQTFRDLICHAGSGAAAGAIAATFVCPLDVIKTRLQVHGVPSGHKDTDRQRLVWRGCGAIFNLFKKLLIIIFKANVFLSTFIFLKVYFTVYERLKHLLHSHDESNQLTVGANMVAAAGAGAATAISTNPLWVVKTRLQVVRSRLQEQGQSQNSEVRYAGVIDCIKKVFRKEGIPGFYRGCATNLLRTTPSAVITFTSYEMIHRFLERVIPPDKNNSQDYPKPDGHANPQQGNGGMVKDNNKSVIGQCQAQLNKRTTPISLGNKEQLTTRH